jgi:hypothetical protein
MRSKPLTSGEALEQQGNESGRQHRDDGKLPLRVPSLPQDMQTRPTLVGRREVSILRNDRRQFATGQAHKLVCRRCRHIEDPNL